MLTREELPGGEERWTSNDGELRVRHPSRGVVVFVEKGFLSAAFAPHIVRGCNDALLQADRVTVFVDGYDLERYDPEIRNAGTAILKDNAQRIVAQHMLVRSRIAKMGLSVVSLLLGGVIHGHHERHTFDAELAHAVFRARELDSRPAPPLGANA